MHARSDGRDSIDGGCSRPFVDRATVPRRDRLVPIGAPRPLAAPMASRTSRRSRVARRHSALIWRCAGPARRDRRHYAVPARSVRAWPRSRPPSAARRCRCVHPAQRRAGAGGRRRDRRADRARCTTPARGPARSPPADRRRPRACPARDSAAGRSSRTAVASQAGRHELDQQVNGIHARDAQIVRIERDGKGFFDEADHSSSASDVITPLETSSVESASVARVLAGKKLSRIRSGSPAGFCSSLIMFAQSAPRSSSRAPRKYFRARERQYGARFQRFFHQPDAGPRPSTTSRRSPRP